MTPDEHPNTPILEAILQNQDMHGKDQTQALEHLLVQADKNNPEPILEAQIMQADKNAKEIVKAVKESANLTIEISGADTTMYKGEKGDTGNTFDEMTPEQKAEIKGDQGDKGDKGDKGEQGEKGEGISPETLAAIQNTLEFASRRSSKTVSLVELDDVDLTSATKTNGKYVITSAETTATLANAAATSSNVTGSRAKNTTYTNGNATKSILVIATFRCAITLGAGVATLQAKSDTSTPPTTIASGLVGIQAGLLNEDNTFMISFVVPAGATQNYRIDTTETNGTVTLGTWMEYVM